MACRTCGLGNPKHSSNCPKYRTYPDKFVYSVDVGVGKIRYLPVPGHPRIIVDADGRMHIEQAQGPYEIDNGGGG